MNILFALGHPAHYHLFKNISSRLKINGHNVLFVITPKDILENLLKTNNEKYCILANRENQNNLIGKFFKLLKSTNSLIRIAKQNHADVIVGCLSQIAYAGRYLRIPSIFVGEDDFSYTWPQGLITYPFITNILAPETTNVKFFSYKKISYCGYQKLSYLHPNLFNPTKAVRPDNKKQILIRLVNLSAYHDVSAKGLNNKVLSDFIKKFNEVARIYISSERELPSAFEHYRIKIDVNKMHEFLFNSDLFIGDSQSMAVEASLLGVPNIRINNFAGKISVLNELEYKYKLTVSLHPRDAQNLINIAHDILTSENAVSEYEKKKDKMLSEKIDVTAFMVWFIENYPESIKIMKENPNYQFHFQ